MSRTYTVSVVGAGIGGQISMIGARDSDRLELAAICDINPDALPKLVKHFPDAKMYTSHQAMFAECPTDIICVSTFAPSHREIALAALDLPTTKGVLVEKPLGDTSAAGRDVIRAVQARNVPMVVPHSMIVEGCGKAILEQVHQGAIGELRLVEIESDKWDILNAGIHWLNFFVTLTGNEPVASVLATCDTSTRTFRDGMQVETEAVTYITMQSGVRCVLHTGDNIPIVGHDGGALFRIIGTRGMIEYSDMQPHFRLMNWEYPEGMLITPERAARTKHQIYLEALAEMIDGDSADFSIPNTSLAALEICEAAYLSHHHRCNVTFPLEQFTPPPPNNWQPGKPYSGSGGGRDGRGRA